MAAADTARLIASLELKDQMSAGLGRIDDKLGKLETSVGRVGRAGGALRVALGVGLERVAETGISALFSNIQKGEEGLRQLQDIQAQTAAVIESTGAAAGVSAEQVRALAEAQEDLTTVDDKVVQTGENLLLTFTNIGKDVFPDATEAMVNMAVALNDGDASLDDLSNTAIQVGKALNDPIRGVTALRRVGVQLTKQQEDQIKTFVKSGDIISAQKVILGELETEFGKAGEAAGKSGAAGIRRLDDAVEDTRITLATGLAPALDRIRDKIAKKLGDPATQRAVKDLGRFLGDAAEKGLEFAEKIPWDKVGDGLRIAAEFAGKVVETFTNLPPEVQATIVGLAGLNKLSGGAVTGLVSELGKGLIKGVLGMTAGVVNLKAATVTGVGGGGGVVPAGASAGKSKIGAAAGALGKVFIVGAAAGAFIELANILGDQSKGNKELEQALDRQTQKFTSGASLADLQKSLAGVDQQIYDLQYGSKALTPEGIAYALNIDGVRTSVEKSRADLIAAIEKQKQDAFAIRDAVSRVPGPITGAINAAKAVAVQTTAAARAAGQQTAAAIRDKDLSVSVQNVNQITTNVSVRETINGQTTFKQYQRYIS